MTVCGRDTLGIQVPLSAQPLLSDNLFLIPTREALDCRPARSPSCFYDCPQGTRLGFLSFLPSSFSLSLCR